MNINVSIMPGSVKTEIINPISLPLTPNSSDIFGNAGLTDVNPNTANSETENMMNKSFQN